MVSGWKITNIFGKAWKQFKAMKLIFGIFQCQTSKNQDIWKAHPFLNTQAEGRYGGLGAYKQVQSAIWLSFLSQTGMHWHACPSIYLIQ